MKIALRNMKRLPYGLALDRGGTVMPPPFYDIRIGYSVVRYPVATAMLMRHCLEAGLKVSLVKQ